MVGVSLQNGSNALVPLNRIYISHGGHGPRRNFNNNRGGNFRNNRNNYRNGQRNHSNNGERNGHSDRAPRDNKGSSEQ